MPATCPRKQPGCRLWATLAAVALAAPAAWAQPPDVQKLFQEGAYAEVIEAARDGDAVSIYLAAQALVRLDDAEGAAAAFARLETGDDESWRLVGESGAALVAGDAARAVELGRRAVAARGDHPWAHYQLGLAASRQGDFAAAARAFARAVEIKPDLAYGHYYAAQAWQRQRQLSKAADHFEAFLRLAPSAPERQAVVAIMRTLK